MRLIPVRREVPADAEAVWEALVDLDTWPIWGPSVRSATLDDGGRRLRAGSRGRVRPVLGPALPFVVTDFDLGRRWAWSVGGVPATGHRVEPLAPGRSAVVFEVPAWAAVYAAVCWRAAGALGAVAAAGAGSPDLPRQA